MKVAALQELRGTLADGNSSATVAFPNSAEMDDARCALFVSYQGNEATPNCENYLVEFWPSASGGATAGTFDQVEIERNGTAGDIEYTVYIVEFDADTDVWWVDWDLTAAETTQNFNIGGTVDNTSPGDAFIISTWRHAGDTATNGQDPADSTQIRSRFNSATQIECERDQATGAVNGHAMVIRSDNISVQILEQSLTSFGGNPGDEDETITSVTEADTFLVSSYMSDSADYPDEGHITAYLLNSTTVRFTVGYNADTMNVTTFIVTDTSLSTQKVTRSDQGTPSPSDTASQRTEQDSTAAQSTTITSVDLTRSVPIPGQSPCSLNASQKYGTSHGPFRCNEFWLNSATVAQHQQGDGGTWPTAGTGDQGAAFYGTVVEFEADASAHTASGTPSIAAVTADGAAIVGRKASGTPSIAAVTADGAATVGRKSSGAPSIPAITADGAAVVRRKASGTPQIPAITADGAATVPTGETASGAASITAITADGAAIVRRQASGSCSIPVITADGAASVRKQASGSPSIPAVQGDGAASVGRKASGTPSIPAVTASGSATVRKQASGTPSIPAVTADGAANVPTGETASGSASIAAIEAAGTAIVRRQASGAATIGAVEADGAASLTRKASGSPSIGAITADGTANGEQVAASGDPSIPSITADGAASVTKKTSGSPSITPVTADGAAVVGRKSSGSPSIPAIEASGQAIVRRQASGAAITPGLTASGNASRAAQASGAVSITPITADGAASVGAVQTASGAVSIPVITADGAAQVTKKASGSPAIPSVTAAGQASVTHKASGGSSIPSITADGSAEIVPPPSASGDPSIPSVTADGTAIVRRKSSGAATIPAITADGLAVPQGLVVASVTGPNDRVELVNDDFERNELNPPGQTLYTTMWLSQPGWYQLPQIEDGRAVLADFDSYFDQWGNTFGLWHESLPADQWAEMEFSPVQLPPAGHEGYVDAWVQIRSTAGVDPTGPEPTPPGYTEAGPRSYDSGIYCIVFYDPEVPNEFYLSLYRWDNFDVYTSIAEYENLAFPSLVGKPFTIGIEAQGDTIRGYYDLMEGGGRQYVLSTTETQYRYQNKVGFGDEHQIWNDATGAPYGSKPKISTTEAFRAGGFGNTTPHITMKGRAVVTKHATGTSQIGAIQADGNAIADPVIILDIAILDSRQLDQRLDSVAYDEIELDSRDLDIDLNSE